MNVDVLLETYGLLLTLAPLSLILLFLLVGALKALNGTDDEESVLYHTISILTFITSSTIYYYFNVNVGIVSYAALFLSFVAFIIYLLSVDVSWYTSAKEEIIVRNTILSAYLRTKEWGIIFRIIAKIISLAFKGDDKFRIALRYFFILFPLVALFAESYPVLGPIVLFLAGYSTKGIFSFLATLVGTAFTLRSFLLHGIVIINYQNLKWIDQSTLEHLYAKVALATITTAITLYSLRGKILSWGPGAAVLVFPMLSIFFIEKGQDPLCSIAYTLGALIAFLLKKGERMEELMDKFVAKLATFGEKIIKLELSSLPYLFFLALTVCPFKNYPGPDVERLEEWIRKCLMA